MAKGGKPTYGTPGYGQDESYPSPTSTASVDDKDKNEHEDIHEDTNEDTHEDKPALLNPGNNPGGLPDRELQPVKEDDVTEVVMGDIVTYVNQEGSQFDAVVFYDSSAITRHQKHDKSKDNDHVKDTDTDGAEDDGPGGLSLLVLEPNGYYRVHDVEFSETSEKGHWRVRI